MKIYIIGNIYSDTKILAKKISDYYGIPTYSLDNIFITTEETKETSIKNYINKISRENKEWIVESTSTQDIDIICNLANTIIFIDYSPKQLKKKAIIDKIKNLFVKKDTKKLSEKYDIINSFNKNIVNEQLIKHIRKGIIIRNKAELKKYLVNMYENAPY